jgi:hypothetical protein
MSAQASTPHTAATMAPSACLARTQAMQVGAIPRSGGASWQAGTITSVGLCEGPGCESKLHSSSPPPFGRQCVTRRKVSARPLCSRAKYSAYENKSVRPWIHVACAPG